MSKKKSIDDLLSSIYILVNEAKKEFENITIESLDSNPNINNEIRTSQEIKESFSKKVDNQTLGLDKKVIKIKTNINTTDWKNIDFSNSKISKSISQDIFNQSNFNDKEMKNKFYFFLDKWIQENLKNLIELEFSNHIKNKNN